MASAFDLLKQLAELDLSGIENTALLALQQEARARVAEREERAANQYIHDDLGFDIGMLVAHDDQIDLPDGRIIPEYSAGRIVKIHGGVIDVEYEAFGVVVTDCDPHGYEDVY